MAYSEGVFSPSTNGDILVKETEFITENRISETRKPIVAGQAILSHQDPTLTLLGEQVGNGMKCVGAKVVAMRTCNNVVETDLSLDCTVPAATEAGSEALQLSKEIISIARFSVWDSDCNNVFSFEDKVAQQKAVAKVNIEVDLTKKLVAYAAAQADTPDAAWFKTPGSIVGNAYQVAEAEFNSKMYADILYASSLTDIYNPIMINGRNFYHDTFLAQYKGSACCDNDAVLNGAPWSIFFDIRNVDSILGAETSLIIDKNSLLSWFSVEWQNTVPNQVLSDTFVWSEPLPRLTYTANGVAQQIYVDIRARKACRNGKDYGVHYEVILSGKILANLPNCESRKGILKIENTGTP